jgi:hypothetical protein
MGQTREIAGSRRRTDADEADIVILQRTRRDNGHHFIAGEINHDQALPFFA